MPRKQTEEQIQFLHIFPAYVVHYHTATRPAMETWVVSVVMVLMVASQASWLVQIAKCMATRALGA